MAKRKNELKAVKRAKARERQKNRRRKRAIILGVEVVILLFLLGTMYVMAKYDKFQTVRINSEDIEINDGADQEGYTTVALFGGDSREGELEAGTHADTMLVVSINNKTKEIRMVSIYRDTLLEQMDGTFHKANNAYYVGGPTEAINMLNKNLDLDIQDYVTVDFKAMSDVVDLLGGIEINLKDAEAEMMNKYVKETARVAGKKAHLLESGGTYTLDGPQAVTYARLRKLKGGDYKRTERQRVVIRKVFDKAKKADIATLNKIIDAVFPQVSTSISLKKMVGLASGAAKYKLGDNEGFPFEKTDGIKYSNAGSIVVAVGLAENVQELHKFLYPDEEVKPVSETVQKISDNISYLTGVVRPADMDTETVENTEDSTSKQPVIENVSGENTQNQ